MLEESAPYPFQPLPVGSLNFLLRGAVMVPRRSGDSKDMAKPPVKITKRVVDALAPPESGEIILWDSELKGFGLRVQSTGVMSFMVKYRSLDRRQRKVSIARVGAMAPEEARRRAREILAGAAKGDDEAEGRKRSRQALNLSEVSALYLEYMEGRIKASTLEANRGQIENHIKPLIGKIPINALTHGHVVKFQSDVIAGKSARSKGEGKRPVSGGPAAARRVVLVLSGVLEFAKKRRMILENVAQGAELPADRKRTRFLSLEEIAALGKALKEEEAEGASATAMNGVRFLLLTGLRRDEAMTLTISAVNKSGGCLMLEETKTGPQNRPIGLQAFDVIERQIPRNGWVFPAGRGRGRFASISRVVPRIAEKAGLTDVTTHTLRHTFASVAAEMGISELIIAGLLGHRTPGITARYAHLPDSALVSAANRVSARIADALEGRETGQVVEFRQA